MIAWPQETAVEPEDFRLALEQVLPADLPHRPSVVAGAARHLALVAEANQRLNLTRILAPREAAVKHVWDSLVAAPYLAAGGRYLDLGTGGGFPGIPLSLARPDCRFLLVDSVRKKAREVAGFVTALGLSRVEVSEERAEAVLREQSVHGVLVRAVAPIGRLLRLLQPVGGRFQEVLFYKGPEVEAERQEARALADRMGLEDRVLTRVELPDQAGTRVLLCYRRAARGG